MERDTGYNEGPRPAVCVLCGQQPEVEGSADGRCASCATLCAECGVRARTFGTLCAECLRDQLVDLGNQQRNNPQVDDE